MHLASGASAPADPAILEGLETVMDPEAGLSIVDLGLVYRAERHGDRISVMATLILSP